MIKKIQVCISPKLFNLYNDNNSIIILVDIFRASSTICSAFENGVKEIIPVGSVQEAIKLKSKNKEFVLCGERDGKKVKNFDYGNSPIIFSKKTFVNKTVILTTTNGTKSIDIARKCKNIVIGSFLNITSLSNWLINQDKNIIILCAGWKGKFSLEDTLFAGNLSNILIKAEKCTYSLCDATINSIYLWNLAKKDKSNFLKENASHYNRLKKNHNDDINFCLKDDISTKIPIVSNKSIKLLRNV